MRRTAGGNSVSVVTPRHPRAKGGTHPKAIGAVPAQQMTLLNTIPRRANRPEVPGINLVEFGARLRHALSAVPLVVARHGAAAGEQPLRVPGRHGR
jgi:hypothetical protein